jgi:hypothetical protein
LRLSGKGLSNSLALGIGLVVVRRRRCCLGVGSLGSSLGGLLFCSAGLLLAAAEVISGGLRLQLRSGFAQGVESILAELQFLGQLVTALAFAVAHVFLGVYQLSLAQQRCNLRFQLDLGFEHPLVTHFLVFGGIGLDLGAIQSHVAQANQARLLGL